MEGLTPLLEQYQHTVIASESKVLSPDELPRVPDMDEISEQRIFCEKAVKAEQNLREWSENQAINIDHLMNDSVARSEARKARSVLLAEIAYFEGGLDLVTRVTTIPDQDRILEVDEAFRF